MDNSKHPMNVKPYIWALALSLSTSAHATIFSCLDEAGNTIYTDTKRNCVEPKELTQYKTSKADSSFYNEIPDLLQTKESANFAGGGTQFCGPVAASNALAWLKGEQSEDYQIQLVHKLSSKEYMNTNSSNGTGTTGFIRGILKYANEELGGYKRLEYRGWKKGPPEYKSNLSIPTLAFMKSGLNRRGGVWLNIGWYDHDKLTNEYKRVGGHWVTLAGQKDNQLVIHDPAPRAGRSFSNEFVNISILPSGTLIGKKFGLPKKATGFITLGKGMHIPSRATTAIVDGAVILQL